MTIFHSIAELSSLSGPLIVVGGTFDGVHVGHQALLRAAQEEAKRCGGHAVVMTFDQHPAALLRPDQAPRLLTTTSQKIKLLQKFGVETLLLLSFNEALAAMPAEKFIQKLVAAGNPLKTICLGEAWSFGQGGKGNLELLRQKGEEFHFSVTSMNPVEVAGRAVSSTRIRQAIAAGDFEDVIASLGRYYELSGVVVSGAGRGKKLGFPTANLDVSALQLPPYGVYAVRAKINDVLYPGVANIGVRPTIDVLPASPTVEIHLLNFQGNLYGKEITIELGEYLRREKKFSTLQELQSQILSDVEEARKILKENSP